MKSTDATVLSTMGKHRFGAIFPIFRGPFLAQVALGNHVPVFLELNEYYSEYSPPSLRADLSDWFDFFYGLLFKHYRSEYVYKNIVTTTEFLDADQIGQSLLSTEMRSGNSRADLVILNGTSTIYEIKSEFDSFDRLDSQLADYGKVFDRIIVVTTEEKAHQLESKVADVVGVMSLDSEGKLNYLKEPLSNKRNTDPATIFNCMRQSEFRQVIKNEFGYVPNVPNTQLYKTCIKLFCGLDPVIAHDRMVECVSIRNTSKENLLFALNAPQSLKHACLSFSRSRSMTAKIDARLKEPLCRLSTSRICEASKAN